MALLNQEEIDGALSGLADGWTLDGSTIVRAFECGDFVGSVRFVDSLVEPAEDLGHHPDIAISWSTWPRPRVTRGGWVAETVPDDALLGSGTQSSRRNTCSHEPSVARMEVTSPRASAG